MLKNEKGIIKLAYILVLVFLGALLWMYWQSGVKNYSLKSIEFDNSLSDILVENKINDINILTQSRQEKTSGISLWIEYYKEIRLPNLTNVEVLLTQIKNLALESLFYQRTCTIFHDDNYDVEFHRYSI